ncbi:hypothetical protein K449DRAFT_395202 [Hypoxylon sp. EC38]|nr:hypothetical protein K449DRAFT_395202 [Hypoxylon sp. EC38]
MSSIADPVGVSFKAAHNVVHNAVGSSFASVGIAAFDSLLMAVHSNTTYQSQSYMSPGLYTTARENPLNPFHKVDGQTLNTGPSVATLEPFGYTYPELKEWEERGGMDRDQRKKDVILRIIDLCSYKNYHDDINGL